MATVTGFTSERMLVIENETVVDGEIQGDDLILITREGTPINAGNVRGPIGPIGPPVSDTNKGDITVSGGGTNWQLNPDVVTNVELAPNAVTNVELADMPANTIKGALVAGDPINLTPAQLGGILPVARTVNDQTGNVYGPRFFANGIVLQNEWGNAPHGALAVTTDTFLCWVKNNAVWVPDPMRTRNWLGSGYGTFADGGLFVQAHSHVLTLNGNGDGSIAFPYNFTALPVVLVCMGMVSVPAFAVMVHDSNVTIGGFNINVRYAAGDGGPIGNGVVRIQYVAFGR